jgi:hypothetical protein
MAGGTVAAATADRELSGCDRPTVVITRENR